MIPADTPLGIDRDSERFFALLEQYHEDAIAYVYRVDDNDQPIRPYWLRAWACPELVDLIQERGGGRFHIIIRRGRIMQFSGKLAFARRLAHG